MQYGEHFAKIYEKETAGDTESWKGFYLQKTADFNEICDIGCGTGRFSRLFAKAGHSVIAADISEPMLQRAAELAKTEGVHMRFLCQNAEKLSLAHPTDCVTAVCDVINYSKKPSEIFGRVFSCLRPGGLFLFDISSERKLTALPAKFPYIVSDGPDMFYVWQNRAGKGSVKMDITFFGKGGGSGQYARFDENHTQYIHKTDDILAALTAAGLKETCVYGESFGRPRAKDERLFFESRKP